MSAFAQAPAAAPAAPAGPPRFVATVDLGRLMQSHPEFKAKMEVIQEQKKKLDAEFLGKQNALREQAKKLDESGIRPGTDPYQQQVEEITKAYGNLEVEAKNELRKLEVKNSTVIYDIFSEIKQELSAYCKHYGIAQVTDVRKMEVVPTIPQTVMEDIEQRLVWSDEQIDLTNTIKMQLYKKRGLQVPAETAVVGASPTATLQPTTASPNNGTIPSNIPRR
jgi:Skp family chaperone for outer membrane proteins